MPEFDGNNLFFRAFRMVSRVGRFGGVFKKPLFFNMLTNLKDENDEESSNLTNNPIDRTAKLPL